MNAFPVLADVRSRLYCLWCGKDCEFFMAFCGLCGTSKWGLFFRAELTGCVRERLGTALSRHTLRSDVVAVVVVVVFVNASTVASISIFLGLLIAVCAVFCWERSVGRRSQSC